MYLSKLCLRTGATSETLTTIQRMTHPSSPIMTISIFGGVPFAAGGWGEYSACSAEIGPPRANARGALGASRRYANASGATATSEAPRSIAPSSVTSGAASARAQTTNSAS